jgi:hypothetical protein
MSDPQLAFALVAFSAALSWATALLAGIAYWRSR